jgi:hypothetical protein
VVGVERRKGLRRIWAGKVFKPKWEKRETGLFKLNGSGRSGGLREEDNERLGLSNGPKG